ncbi:MAG: hypothetical protein H0Z29_07110 [Candidatus Marinimicrobia bacterium]|nr:hypothetical protein [Candidatus Neomarinimicrobiota bacterium]
MQSPSYIWKLFEIEILALKIKYIKSIIRRDDLIERKLLNKIENVEIDSK